MPHSPSVLVTGATGFIGSVLTRQLVAEGVHVRILRRETSSLDLLEGVLPQVDPRVADVTRARGLYDAMKGIDRVYHVAAKVSFASHARDELRRVNVQGTANVVNVALEAGVNRLVHTSSMAAFGRPLAAEAVIDESTTWHGADHRSAYARSKYLSELEVHRGIAEGLEAVVVNPALVFGVGRPSTNTRRIVDVIRRGWLPAVPPGGTNVVDVRDVAVGLRRAMEHGDKGRRYFLGSENLSWKEIAETMSDAFDVKPPRYQLPSPLLKAGAIVAETISTVTRTRPLLTRSTAQTASRTYRYDNTRARRELGCTFRPFAETARRIASALRDDEE